MNEHRAYVGLGANLGNPAEQLRRALKELNDSPGVRVESVSSFYRSAPLGAHGVIDTTQPAYVNAVAGLATTLAPAALLRQLLAIEREGGRVRSVPNASRTIDLDLLLYDQVSLTTALLCLPHPRMHARRFVLEPLLEIAPAIEIPGQGSAADFLVATRSQPLERI